MAYFCKYHWEECFSKTDSNEHFCPKCGRILSSEEVSFMKTNNTKTDKQEIPSIQTEETTSPLNTDNTEIRMPRKPLPINFLNIIGVVSLIFTFSITISSPFAPPISETWGYWIPGVFCLIGSYFLYQSKKEEYERAMSDFEAYKNEKVREKIEVRQTVEKNMQQQKAQKLDVERKRTVAQMKGLPSCPTCGSTAIATVNRGYSALWGFVGSGQPVNVCQVCGHKFRPGT